MPTQHRLWPYQQSTPASPGQSHCQCRQDHPVDRIEPRLPDRAAENAQLVAKEKQLNVTLAIASEPEHEQTQDEPQVVVEAGKNHGRPGW